jgi:sigma-E factor negative regulatory protein RseB
LSHLPRTIAALLLLSSAFSASASADTAMNWVQKMSDAMRQLNYRGNFVYMHGNQLESMRISHMLDDSGEKERLISLNGEAREVIRDNLNLTCIWPSSRKVVVDSSRKNSFSPIFIPDDITRLEKFYEMRILGEDRIADMETVVVHIKPKDRYRYGMKFWINKDHGLMMKSSLLDEQDQEIEQVMFTSIELFSGDEKQELDVMPQIDENFTMVRYHRGDNAGGTASESRWRLTETPGGFWRESVLRRQVPGSDHVIEQMVFTDGLASLSVFIERDDGNTHQGGSSMGAVNAFIRIVGEHSVTAIGEVPAMTVKRVAESVYYQ